MSIAFSTLSRRFASLGVGLLLTLALRPDAALAAVVGLSWEDSSEIEDGFQIERRVESSATFAQIATVGPNVTSYTDSGLPADTSYCYRVRAVEGAIQSDYSNESCATTPPPSFTLAVTRAGSGEGTVSSSLAGITCGTDCSESYLRATSVTLSATPNAGSTFTGWSGGSCSGTGSCTVTLATDTSVTATFTAGPAPGSVVAAINVGGPEYVAADGTRYAADQYFTGGWTAVTTTSIAGTPDAPLYQSGRFGDFSYNIPLSPGSYRVTLKFAETAPPVSAVGQRIFDITMEGQPVITDLDLFARAGKNTATDITRPVTVTDGMLTVQTYTDLRNAQINAIKVTVAPVASSSMSGSAGAAMKASLSPTSLLTQKPHAQSSSPVTQKITTHIGVFRPSTGKWYLDVNHNGLFDGCQEDSCSVEQPLLLSLDSQEPAEACQSADCLDAQAKSDRLPVHGDWLGTGKPQAGTFEPQSGLWWVDLNANGQRDDCRVDGCLGPFGVAGDLPVVGDWDGTGTAKIGIFDPETGSWELDLNENGRWDGCEVDACLGPFGQEGDQPVVGQW